MDNVTTLEIRDRIEDVVVLNTLYLVLSAVCLRRLLRRLTA